MENLASSPPCTPSSNTGVFMLPKKCPQDQRSCDHQDDSKSYEHGRRALSMFQQHQISRAKVTAQNFSGLSWDLFYLFLGPLPPSDLVQVWHTETDQYCLIWGTQPLVTKLAKLHWVNVPHQQPGQHCCLLMTILRSSTARPLIHLCQAEAARSCPSTARLTKPGFALPAGSHMLSLGMGSSRGHACGLCSPTERPYRLPHAIHTANHCQQVEHVW